MAEKTGISVEVKGLHETQQMFRRLAAAAGRGGGRSALHARYAVIASQWIDKNFQSQGALSGGWRPLKPNTLAGRRMGSGRILQNNRFLQASFMPKWNENEAVVGSPVFYALFHEKGTKGSPETPYPIRPKKPGGFLRFKVATRFGARTVTLKSAKKITLPFAEGREVFAREVMHPGLPIRRMLPNENDLLPKLLRTTLTYLKEQERRAG